jgi:putative ABC transport system permease protein
MQRLLWDLRYAMRQLRRSPGFTVTVVLTLALGIGATTAIFSAVYGLLLKSLPFADAGRIVAVAETHPQVAGGVEATFLDYLDWRTQQHSFTDLAAYSIRNPETVSLVMAGQAVQVHRVLASGNFFSVMGVTALAGRTLNAQDDRPGSDAVAVISAAAWRRYFGADPGVVGRQVDMNGASFTVVGVLPAGAAHPAEGEVWLPLSRLDEPTRESRVWHSVKVLGRLRGGVDLAEARTDMQTVAARLAAAYPATNRSESVLLLPLREQLVGTLRPAMLSLLGAVVLVLAIACANVASLLMVRATAARREVAVREALGADRWRLLSQSLAQSAVLCLLGGALGVGLAWGALPLLRVALAHTAGLDASMIASVGLSVPVLLVTLGVCSATALLFGLLPFLRGMRGGSRSDAIVEALRSGDRGSTGGDKWGRGGLIAGEIAIAVVVLFLGTLVVRSYAKLLAVDPGFRTDHLLSAEITLPGPRYTDASPNTARFYEQLLDRLGHAPGVLSAGTTTQTPLKSSQVMTRFAVEGAPTPAPGAYPLAQIRTVSPGFFATMGLRLREGRVFEQKDIDQNADLFVVNETFARRYLSGRGPLGAKVIIGVMSTQPSAVPVIGVVSDAHDVGVETSAQPELYYPGYGVHAVLLVRSAYDAEGVAPVVESATRGLDANLAVYNVKTVDAVLSDSLARQRMTAVLLAIFALVALVLAAIGIYGVLSYSVVQRTREIGVRMAVGANRGDILRLVLEQAGGFAVAGMIVGLAAALAGARLMGGLLFQTSVVDKVSISITLGLLTLVALLAICVPAGRAASVNPTEALRSE